MIKLKKIKPLFNRIVTTANKYRAEDFEGLLTSQINAVKEYQTVIAVGDAVRSIKVGDVVSINPNNYIVRKFKEGSLNDGVTQMNPIDHIAFPSIELDGVQHLMIYDRDIDFVLEEYVEEKPKKIKVPNKKLIIK